jgi:hypothetical protein
MEKARAKEIRNGNLGMILVCVLGTYWTFTKESFTRLEHYDDYILMVLQFLGPLAGVFFSIREMLNPEFSRLDKSISFILLVTSLVFLASLTYYVFLR